MLFMQVVFLFLTDLRSTRVALKEGRLNALYASRIPLLTNLRSTRSGSPNCQFPGQTGSIRSCSHESQANDTEFQELIQVQYRRGKKKDLRIRDSDGMLMQGDQNVCAEC